MTYSRAKIITKDSLWMQFELNTLATSKVPLITQSLCEALTACIRTLRTLKKLNNDTLDIIIKLNQQLNTTADSKKEIQILNEMQNLCLTQKHSRTINPPSQKKQMPKKPKQTEEKISSTMEPIYRLYNENMKTKVCREEGDWNSELFCFILNTRRLDIVILPYTKKAKVGDVIEGRVYVPCSNLFKEEKRCGIMNIKIKYDPEIFKTL